MKIEILKFRDLDTARQFSKDQTEGINSIFLKHFINEQHDLMEYRAKINSIFENNFINDQHELMECRALIDGNDIINLFDNRSIASTVVYNPGDLPIIYNYERYFDVIKSDKERIKDLETRLNQLEDLVYQIRGLV